MTRLYLLLVLVIFVLFNHAHAKLNNVLNKNAVNLDVRTADMVAIVGASDAKVAVGGSDSATSIFNLAKSILGAGILSLPAGIASFSDEKSALGFGTVLLLYMAVVSAYTFSSIGKACSIHNTSTFSDTWVKSIQSKSSKSIVMSTAITFKTLFTCLAYSIIIGDSFSQLLQSLKLSKDIFSRCIFLLIGILHIN